MDVAFLQIKTSTNFIGLLLLLLSISVLVSTSSVTANDSDIANADTFTFENKEIPIFLRPWAQWLQLQNPQWQCTTGAKFDGTDCVWPGFFQLQATNKVGLFQYWIDVDAPSFVDLPGDDTIWPRNITSQSLKSGSVKETVKPLLVLRHSRGTPQVFLQPGRHHIRGRFDWSTVPSRLTLPETIAFVSIKVPDGKTWQRHNDALVFTKKGYKKTVEDSVSIEIFRKLTTSIPQYLETWINIKVAGEPRRIVINNFELDSTQAIDLTTPIPLEVTPKGHFRIQVHQGNHWIKHKARLTTDLSAFTWALRRDKELLNDDVLALPSAEYWSHEPSALRSVTVQGSIIDTSQAQVPYPWQHLASYRFSKDSAISLMTIQSNLTTSPNMLNLQRELWFGFAGDHVSALDSITGQLHTKWRLNVLNPGVLQRASQQTIPLLITDTTNNSAHTKSGIELRQSILNIEAITRYPRISHLPVIGWDVPMQTAEGWLNLPPGWFFLASMGDKGTSDAWIHRWSLWDFFVVVLAISLGFRAFGIFTAGLALGIGVLTYQSSPEILMCWILISILLSLHNQIKAPFLYLWLYRIGLFLMGLLVCQVLLFTYSQVRLIVYPQLEHNQIQSTQVASMAEKVPSHTALMTPSFDIPPQSKSTQTMPAPVPKPVPQNELRHDNDTDFIQTGNGPPQWRWNRYRLFSLDRTESDSLLYLIVLAPWQTGVWRVLSLIFVLAGLIVIARHKLWHREKHIQSAITLTAPGSKIIGILLACMGFWSMPNPVLANTVIPSDQTLQQLQNYLTKPSQCAPYCYAIVSSTLKMLPDQLYWQFEINALGRQMVSLPSSNQWSPTQIKLNGQDYFSFIRKNNQIYVKVPSGESIIEVKGLLYEDNLEFKVDFPVNNIVYDLNRWQTTSTLSTTLTDNIQFRRQLKKTSKVKTFIDPLRTAPFAQVTRKINLDSDWIVETTVQRISPSSGPVQFKIPVLDGERPFTPIEIKNGQAIINMRARERTISWSSELEPKSIIVLKAALSEQYFEVWEVSPSTVWQVRHSGLKPDTNQSSQSLQLKWHPLPAQTVQLKFNRPPPTPGRSQSVDSAAFTYSAGDTYDQGQLLVHLTARSPGQYWIQLNKNMVVEHAQLNGVNTVNIEDGRASVNLVPGVHRFELIWKQPHQPALIQQVPQLKSSLPISNVQVTVKPQKDGWILHVFGPSLGPAVLYWSMLAVILVGSIIIYTVQKRSTYIIPMKRYDWILLGLGTSTLWHYSMLPISLWIFIIAWRATLTPTQLLQIKPWQFKILQIFLLILSIFTLAFIVSLIPSGLLTAPNMLISGNGSSKYVLHWFQDINPSGITPEAGYLMLPKWTHSTLMLVWALWLAHKVVHLVCFAVQSLQHQKIWQLNANDDIKDSPPKQ